MSMNDDFYRFTRIFGPQWTLLPSFAKLPSAFKPHPHPIHTLQRLHTVRINDITARVPSCVL